LKCRYLKHEKAHLAHLVRYIATREGVEMARDTHDHLPATARQKQLIDELLRSLPETQDEQMIDSVVKELTEEELEALVKALTKLNTWFRSF
ncbi:hypothetical protein NE476_31510, partial [Enterocloster bolteae]|nr:hypothetical protein [Enterocloster bolteae]